MQVSVRLAALPIPEYSDFHSGYSAPRSRIAGIYSRIFPNERALSNGSKKLVLASRMLVVRQIIAEDLFRSRNTKVVDRPNATPIVLGLLA